MTCTRCGASRFRTETIKEYEDDGLIGLPGVVVLDAAQKYICEECGEEGGISIPDEAGLEVAVMVARIGIMVKLTGEEVRFLRKGLGLTAKQLAESLQVAEETVSRWENDKLVMSPQTEKVLRLMAGRLHSKDAPGIGFDEDAILKGHIRSVFPDGKRPAVKMSFQRVRILSNPAWVAPLAA